MNTLQIFDFKNLTKNISQIQDHSTITCLGVNLEEVENFLQSQGIRNVQVMDLTKYSDLASANTRNFIIETITNLPLYSQMNKVVDKNYGIDLWHLLLISERSPMRGKIHQRLFFISQLSLLIKDKNYKNLVFNIEDNVISDLFQNKNNLSQRFLKVSVKFYLNSFGYILQTLSIKIIRKFTKTIKSVVPKPFLIFTLFPYWWLGTKTSNPSDRFFPKIPKDMNSQIGYISWITSRADHYLKEIWSKNQNSIISESVILQDYLKLSDITSLLKLKRLTLLLKFRKSIQASSLPLFHDLQVNQIIYDELNNSISNRDFQLCLLIYISLKNYLSLNYIEKIIFRYENQPIDKAIILASGDNVQSVGFWHSSLSICDNYTSFHFPQDFLTGLNECEMFHKGFPRRMLISNLFCRDSLLKFGYREEFTTICGPIRNIAEIEFAKTHIRGLLETRNNRIGIAFSADPHSAEHMLEAIQFISKQNKDIFFEIKTHPAFKTPESFLDTLKISVGEKRFNIINASENFMEAFSNCSAVILGGTQLAFEAILMGIMPIIYQSKSVYNAINFEPFSEWCFVVNTLDEIRKAIKDVTNESDEVVNKKDKWNQLLLKQFGNKFQFSWHDLMDDISRL